MAAVRIFLPYCKQCDRQHFGPCGIPSLAGLKPVAVQPPSKGVEKAAPVPDKWDDWLCGAVDDGRGSE